MVFNRVQYVWNQVNLYVHRPPPKYQEQSVRFLNSSFFKISIGDEVVFNFTSFHNVNWVNKNVYDSCSNITNTTMGSGPIIWTAPQVIITNQQRIITISLIIVLQEDGVKYAVCGVPGHCSNGNMKIKIYVNNSTVPYWKSIKFHISYFLPWLSLTLMYYRTGEMVKAILSIMT